MLESSRLESCPVLGDSRYAAGRRPERHRAGRSGTAGSGQKGNGRRSDREPRPAYRCSAVDRSAPSVGVGDRLPVDPVNKGSGFFDLAVNIREAPPPVLPSPARYELSLLESRRESPSSMSFRFSTEGTGFRYLSNQAIRLALPGVDDPWGAVRTFSLSSSPSEAGFLQVTCKISDTPFKQALAHLSAGAKAYVFGPLGRFLFDASRPSVLIAGGIGITPFRGMIRYASDTGARLPVTLLYSARVPEELVFRAELDDIARSHPNVRVNYTVTRPDESSAPPVGRVGRIDRAWIEEQCDLGVHPRIFVAGLPEMVGEIVTTLTGPLHISPEDIEYELFRGF